MLLDYFSSLRRDMIAFHFIDYFRFHFIIIAAFIIIYFMLHSRRRERQRLLPRLFITPLFHYARGTKEGAHVAMPREETCWLSIDYDAMPFFSACLRAERHAIFHFRLFSR